MKRWRHVVSHRWQLDVVACGMVPKPMSGIPINCRWTFRVLCTSDKVKVIDRVDRIRELMVLLLSSEYTPNLVRSNGNADGHDPSGMVSIGRV